MNILRHVILTLALMSATLMPLQAQIIKGESSVGPKLGYVSKNESAQIGLVYTYAFSNHFRMAPEIGYVFRHKNIDAFMLDLNFHTPFDFTGERVAFYPLAGLNYSSWNSHFKKADINGTDDVSTRTARLGLNLGAGFELRCNSTMKLSIEAKYLLIKHYSTAMLAAGISFVF